MSREKEEVTMGVCVGRERGGAGAPRRSTSFPGSGDRERESERESEREIDRERERASERASERERVRERERKR